MRRLTAGIFTMLLGLVSVSAMGASVVSTQYLDEKLDIELAKKQGVLDTSDSLVTISDDNKINVTTGAITDGAINLVTGGTVYTALELAASEQKLVDDAQSELIQRNANAITILNGDENTTGSVKNEIKVLSDLLSGTSGDVSGLTAQVGANKTAIEKLNADVATTGSVKYSIDVAVKALDYVDAAVQNQFVDSVSQENGVIKVSRRALAAADIPVIQISQVAGLADALAERQVKLTNTDQAIVISEDGVISIATGGIKTGMIADSAVTSEKIADGAITKGKIAANAVESGNIADGAITKGKIADGAVESGNIANGAITKGKIGESAVESGNIADGAITSDKIGEKAVGTDQLSTDVNSLISGAIQAPSTTSDEGTFVLTANKHTAADGTVSYTYAWEDIAGRE